MDKLLAITLRAVGDGVISCDREGRVVLMNAEAERLTGWSQDDAIGRPLKEVFVIVNETTRQTVEDPVDKVFRMGTVVGMANHTLLIRADGTEVAIDDSAAPIYDDADQLRGVVLIFRNVADRRRAEQNLELLSGSGKILGEAQAPSLILERIGALISNHFADVGVFDLLQPSGELNRLIGKHRVAKRQAVADRLKDFIPGPKDTNHPAQLAIAQKSPVFFLECTDEVVQRIAISPEHLEYLRHKLRCRSLLAVPIHADGVVLGALTLVRDLFATPFNELDVIAGEELGARLGLALHYARVREELAAERARLDAILESVPVGVLVADASGRIIVGNKELDRILRRPLQAADSIAQYGDRFAMNASNRALSAEEYPMARAVQKRETTRGEELLYQRGDGSEGWISVSGAPVIAPDGKLLGGVVTVADIDEQKNSRDLLVRSEDRFRTLIERASVGINIGDEHGHLSYINPALLKLIGYTEEEVRRGEVRWDQLTPARYAEADKHALEQLHSTGVAKPYEKSYRGKDGQLVPMLLGAAMIPSLKEEDDSEDVAVFFTDLTAQKRAEAALVQSEKLAAVGKLAASISHEINNPLEAVTNLLFIVRSDPSLSQQAMDYLEWADRELSRVSQVTSQTLRFHRQSSSPMTVSPESLLEEVLSLYGTRLSNSNVRILRDYSPSVTMTCYEGDIRQVLNNLIGNAFDAMRTGGKLTIRTRNATRWSTGDKGVSIIVADTGTGMSPQTLNNIFEAFYTTKGIGGTGLGLWISCRIVHKHRGYIRAYSSMGDRLHGSVFVLWLPHRLAGSANEPWHLEDETPV